MVEKKREAGDEKRNIEEEALAFRSNNRVGLQKKKMRGKEGKTEEKGGCKGSRR